MAISRAKNTNSAADLGNKAKLWPAADKLRNQIGATEYKHVVLGLIFLKYISGAFEEIRAKILACEGDTNAAASNDCIPLLCPPESLWNIANEVSAHA
jgi:type I restriction enzyme M protein